MSHENQIFNLEKDNSLSIKIVKGPDFYSLKELAKLFNVNYQTMFRLVKDTNLVGFQFGKKGSSWRIPKDEVLAFINNICCTN